MKPYRSIFCFASLATLCGCEQAATVGQEAQAATPPVAKRDTEHTVVVELFQSQGCSSCPPANAAVNAIADRPDVVALSFAITYWDRLGWKDSFGDKKYTQRQYDYAAALRNANVYTPQVVVNGVTAITAIRKGELATAIAEAKALEGPAVSVSGNSVRIAAGSGRAEVLLVRFDPRIHNVAIRSGENGGRTLPHKNIVRQLVRLGTWEGKPASYPLPPSIGPLKSAILVQRERAGAIIAARII